MTSLTAADVWKLKELEAKATPAPWFWDMTISLRPFAACADSGYADLPHKKSDGQLIAHMRNALPALLSMLQPPAAADVAEARRILEHVCAGGGTSMVGVIHTLLSDHARLAGEVEQLKDRVTNRDAQLVTQAGAHMLAMTGARCDLSAERAKSARLGSAKEKLDKRLHDTRVKLAKVECEASVHYEDMRRIRGRCERLEKALRWAAPFLPEDGTIDVTVQSALSATEAK